MRRRCLVSENEMESGIYHVTLCSLSCDLFKTSGNYEISFSKLYLEREKKNDNIQENVRVWRRVQTRNGSVEGGKGLIVTIQLVLRTLPLVTTDKFSLASRLKASRINVSFYPALLHLFHIVSSLVFCFVKKYTNISPMQTSCLIIQKHLVPLRSSGSFYFSS